MNHSNGNNNASILQPFPSSMEQGITDLLGEEEDTTERAINLLWSDLKLQTLDQPFALPSFPHFFSSIHEFVKLELQAQVEMNRNELSMKCHRLGHYPPRDDSSGERGGIPDKHLRFPLPYLSSNLSQGDQLTVDFSTIHKVPARGIFTNYVVVLQRLAAVPQHQAQGSSTNTTTIMKDITLAYCTQLRKNEGAIFCLGSDAASLCDYRRVK